MSTTPVTPLASQTLKVSGSRALLRLTSSAYGTTALKSAASGRVYGLPDWKKCTCESTSPGTTHLPRPSMTFAPWGSSSVMPAPASWILSPAITSVAISSTAAAPSRSG